MNEPPLRPDEWANILLAKIAEAIGELPIEDEGQARVRMMVADTLPLITPGSKLARIRAICAEPLDEREGHGPTRAAQFLRIDALLNAR